MFSLTEKQKQLKQAAFNFAQKEILKKNPNTLMEMREHRRIWKASGKLGLLGIGIKKDYGGSGGCYLDQVIVIEELSKFNPMYAILYNQHYNECAASIYHYGTEEQKRKYLPKLCSGERYCTFAAYNPQPSDTEEAIRVRAEKQKDWYILNGYIITNRLFADIFIIYVKMSGSVETSLTAFIVERGFHGFSMVESCGGSLHQFQDCKVPIANILGKENLGMNMQRSCMNFEFGVMTAGPVGLMQLCCDNAFRHVREKNKLDLFKDVITDMRGKLSASRIYLHKVISDFDNGHSNSHNSHILMLECTKNAEEVIQEVKKIFGGNSDGAMKVLLDYLKTYQTFTELKTAEVLLTIK